MHKELSEKSQHNTTIEDSITLPTTFLTTKKFRVIGVTNVSQNFYLWFIRIETTALHSYTRKNFSTLA